jgi:hypothetical protein
MVQLQHSVANDPCGIVAAHAAGIDHQVIQQRIIDVGVEIGFHVLRPGLFFLETEPAGFFRASTIIPADAFDAICERRDGRLLNHGFGGWVHPKNIGESVLNPGRTVFGQEI